MMNHASASRLLIHHSSFIVLRFPLFALIASLALFLPACGRIAEFPGDPVLTPDPDPKDQPPTVQNVIEPRDPVRIFQPTVNLTIYHFTVPAGTVSRNEEFWKHADEQAIDILTHDVLYKNGFRVGRGSLADFEYYLSIMRRQPLQSSPMLVAAAGAKLVEMPMKKDVPSQIIYDFDLRNTLTIRTYDNPSDNILCIDFQPAPRKPGDLRVAIVPMVRTLRKRLVPINDLDTREVEYMNPEKRFELNLRTDVPLDSFLILAPSPEAFSAMSLGRAFMIQEGPAEELEDVLLIIPRSMRRPDTRPATTPAK